MLDTESSAKVRYSSRKFLTMVVVCLGATALLWYGRIEQEVWQDVIAWSLVPYFMADVAPKVAAAWRRQ